MGTSIADWIPEVDTLDFVQDEVSQIEGFWDQRPSRSQGLGAFFGRIRSAIRLIGTEPEIITFAVFQWAAIALGYFLFIQLMHWIPQERWEAIDNPFSWPLWAALFWASGCMSLTSFLLGFFSACMGAAHWLHRQGERSTIGKCIARVRPNMRAIWTMHSLDAWATVITIGSRVRMLIPWRKSSHSGSQEALYYAWKMGLSGMLPSLVVGEPLLTAGRQSIGMVKACLFDVAMLRIGYSVLCWLVALGVVCAMVYTGVYQQWVLVEVTVTMYDFYRWVGLYIVGAVGVVQLVVRPVFILASCDIYHDYRMATEPRESS